MSLTLNRKPKRPRPPKAPKCKQARCTASRGKRKLYCDKHHSAAWRLRFPWQAAFADLRSHAKARAIPFTLDYDTFIRLFFRFDFQYGKRNTSDAPTIDRINPRYGYTNKNVQVLTRSENTRKQMRARARESRKQKQPEIETPF